METHALGEPCDICGGTGLDYIGRECRRWAKESDPNYPPPEVRPARQDRILFFGGPLNEQMVAVRQGETVMLAPIPERVSWPLNDDDPMAPAIRTVRYDIEKVATPSGQSMTTWRVGVAEGFPRQRITNAMNAVLILCSLPICAAKHSGLP